MHWFASVFMCFHWVLTAETGTFGIFHNYTRIHMYHTLYMKYTVLQVFSCVFTVSWLQKHVFMVYFSCIQEYTCTILYKWNALFCKYFYVFSLCLDCRNIYLWYISHVYKNTYVPYFNMKCTVLQVFSLCFYCRNLFFWYISNVYKNTHVPNFNHEMHCFPSVFMCFHCVFTAETYTFWYIINVYKNTPVPYFIH
jgi:hypothetical protein